MRRSTYEIILTLIRKPRRLSEKAMKCETAGELIEPAKDQGCRS